MKQTFGLADFLDFGINKRATCINVQHQNREKKNDIVDRYTTPMKKNINAFIDESLKGLEL